MWIVVAVPVGDDENKRFVGVFEDTYDAIWKYLERRMPLLLVEDAVSQVYTIAWAKWPSVRQPELHWLYGVARNVVRQSKRTRNVESTGPMDFANEHEIQIDYPNARSEALLALRSLSADDQEVLMLVGWELLDPVDCAEVLGISQSAFRVRLHRARNRLEAAMSIEHTSERNSR